jgi:hypothetical protein
VFEFEACLNAGSYNSKLTQLRYKSDLHLVVELVTVCLYVRYADMRTGSYVLPCMLFKSTSCIQIKNKMSMLFLDQNFMLFSMVLFFYGKSNIMYMKCVKLFTETTIAFKRDFQHICSTELTGNQEMLV